MDKEKRKTKTQRDTLLYHSPYLASVIVHVLEESSWTIVEKCEGLYGARAFQ